MKKEDRVCDPCHKLSVILYTHECIILYNQEYLSPQNEEGDEDAHRGIGEVKPKIQVQKELDSAPPDMVI